MNCKIILTLVCILLFTLPSLADGNVIHSWETEQGNCGHQACKGDVTPVVPDTPSNPSMDIPTTQGIPSSILFPAQYNHQPMINDIDNNKNGIENNRQAIENIGKQVNTNTSSINNIQKRLDNTNSRINRLDNKLESGLATVTALTSLHPNPKGQGRTQVAVGAGMYRDNVAGAVGIFHFINDNTMLSAGASYGGDHEFAGNVGITFNFGGGKKK